MYTVTPCFTSLSSIEETEDSLIDSICTKLCFFWFSTDLVCCMDRVSVELGSGSVSFGVSTLGCFSLPYYRDKLNFLSLIDKNATFRINILLKPNIC